MYVELERARLTRMMSKMDEAEGKISEAADTLQEVAVETVGSMEAKEKADFLMEQIRLCLAKKDYVRTEIIAKKVNPKNLNGEDFQDLKLKFYQLMIQYHMYFGNYLEICKAWRSIFNTPKIIADSTLWKQALKRVVLFAILSPWDAEVSDILTQLTAEKKLNELPPVKAILDQFLADELITWPLSNESEWKPEEAFTAGESKKASDRWVDFHKRIVQHNIRVIGMYYSRITSKRLAELLRLDDEKTETYLSEMVSDKQLYAKINRPTGIVTFQKPSDSNDQLESWSRDISDVIGLVEKTCHLINKENMFYQMRKAAKETE